MDDIVEWVRSDGLTPYPDAVEAMHRRIARIAAGEATECIWLVEHPPIYTAGVSARPYDLTDPNRFPVYKSERGGQYTYHGPGQRVAYPMLDLRRRNRDVRMFVRDIETWIITTLASFNVRGEMREGRVGVWVNRSRPGSAPQEDKIAAIGIRIRQWISFHGLAINVEPDLAHFAGIVPCGISAPDLGVTSLADLGLRISMSEFDDALRDAFERTFDRHTKVRHSSSRFLAS
ncbi:MAG: lipoyl(octanoyl) transferase LipB [Alphaproteobacteria bacterium]|nr:lipoyl(octanoyl) transferase LipB [Alphaproteobacteria bacterium]